MENPHILLPTGKYRDREKIIEIVLPKTAWNVIKRTKTHFAQQKCMYVVIVVFVVCLYDTLQMSWYIASKFGRL